MTPDDLAMVRRSWTELRRRRNLFLERLEEVLGSVLEPAVAGESACRLVEAADELLDSLATPSDLAGRARALATAWPPTTPLPRVGIEGAAWRRAASETCPSSTQDDDAAWHRAWLLLADVLAEDALAPFDGPRGPACFVPPPPPT
ncbi:MAG: hypothetical protein ABWZ42_06485 [Ilumatobacteraceae bacterium]